MSRTTPPTRRVLLAGAATSLALLAGTTGSLAQGRGRFFGDGIDGDGPFDDERLYRDEDGRLYRRRGGRYEPYSERGGDPRAARREAIDPAYEEPDLRRGPDPVQPTQAPQPTRVARPVDDGPIDYARAYAAITDEPFPVHAFNWRKANPAFLRQEVAYTGREPVGTIVVDPRAHQLLLVQPNGRARRYGVGVGKQGFSWSGVSTVNSKQMWPDWYPPKEMIARTPKLARQVTKLQSGLGVPGGSRNPLGARAHYLWQDNKDTLYRIHGTLEPESIGRSVSSGCIRMINQDVIDLYDRVEIGSRVVVLT
ncbi:L,D-transpeptidase [Methylobacterium gossipiicola]|uniref:Lipoprotein-anchoring transpeptidase ErfK/SrfK n=1 Tax=Methylobacterium gossipiicola TaxID=582675 RepID=A0A1I2S0J1_9HYPH|nr:L,D-transpeptidase [Methylobacterium gossipiicola]SFG43556.1 Lipoprotein-anchoring transpeptidase ErfK/SrfK [Methylobacterium gossipiicola]